MALRRTFVGTDRTFYPAAERAGSCEAAAVRPASGKDSRTGMVTPQGC